MRARSLVGDGALALTLAGLMVLITATSGDWADAPDRHIDAFGLGLVAAAGLVLVVRRRWPLAVLGVAAAATSAYLAIGYPYGPIVVAFFVAVYTVARHRPLSRAVPAALIALLVMLTHLFTNSAALPAAWGILPASAWVIVPFALGVTVQMNRQSAARARSEVIRQRVDEERLLMAQEVHDIVGHGLAAIRMQADVALHVRSKRPEQAEVALEAISRTSGEALEELRATLGALRHTDVGLGSAGPRLSDLDDLTQRMRDAGLRIDVKTVGAPRPLPPAVDLTGYRVVQESLTNVLRHSDAEVATVRLGYEADTVAITVASPAPAAATDGEGLGLSGMRARVTALGGQLRAGRTADDRFEVHAVIPTGERP